MFWPFSILTWLTYHDIRWYKLTYGKLQCTSQSTGQPGLSKLPSPPKINEIWSHEGETKVRWFFSWFFRGLSTASMFQLLMDDRWKKINLMDDANLMDESMQIWCSMLGWLTLREVWSWRGNEVTSWRSNVKVWRCAMWRRNHWKTRELRLEDSEMVVEQKRTIQPGWWFQWFLLSLLLGKMIQID